MLSLVLTWGSGGFRIKLLLHYAYSLLPSGIPFIKVSLLCPRPCCRISSEGVCLILHFHSTLGKKAGMEEPADHTSQSPNSVVITNMDIFFLYKRNAITTFSAFSSMQSKTELNLTDLD